MLYFCSCMFLNWITDAIYLGSDLQKDITGKGILSYIKLLIKNVQLIHYFLNIQFIFSEHPPSNFLSQIISYIEWQVY